MMTSCAIDCARAHPPAPPHARVRRCQLDTAHEPAQSHVGDRGMRRDAVDEQRAQLVGAGADGVEHRPRVEQLQVPERHRGRQRVPRVGVPVVQRALGEVGAEEGVGDALRRQQVARVFAGEGAGAQPGAHDAGIEQVGAHPGLADFAGVDLDEHVEAGLADRVEAPVREDVARHSRGDKDRAPDRCCASAFGSL